MCFPDTEISWFITSHSLPGTLSCRDRDTCTLFDLSLIFKQTYIQLCQTLFTMQCIGAVRTNRMLLTGHQKFISDMAEHFVLPETEPRLDFSKVRSLFFHACTKWQNEHLKVPWQHNASGWGSCDNSKCTSDISSSYYHD